MGKSLPRINIILTEASGTPYKTEHQFFQEMPENIKKKKGNVKNY